MGGRLRARGQTQPHELVGRFSEASASLVLDDFGAQSVKVRVAKLGALPGVREIGVAIERIAGGR